MNPLPLTTHIYLSLSHIYNIFYYDEGIETQKVYHIINIHTDFRPVCFLASCWLLFLLLKINLELLASINWWLMGFGVIHLDARVKFSSLVISMFLIFMIGISSQTKEIMTFAWFGTKIFNNGMSVKRFGNSVSLSV